MIGLLPPILSALFASGLIFYAYKNRKSSNSKIIPSLFFIKKLKASAPRSKKRKLPFRFFLETLFVILITSILLLANDLSNKKKYRLVLDISQSMGTKSADGTRLDSAKLDLVNFVKSQDIGAEYLLETIPPTDLPKELVDPTRLANLLKPIQVIPIPDNYSKLGELEYSFNDSIVFSDKKILGTSFSQKKVYFKPETNLALISVKTQNSGSKKTLIVSYFFSGSGSNSYNISIKNISTNSTIHKSKIDVLAPGRGSIGLELSGELQKDAIYKASITTNLQLDSLASDDNLYFKVTEESNQEILLIDGDGTNSETLGSIRPILSGISRIISETEFLNLKVDDKEKSPLHIYYKSRMPNEINAPSLIILPTSSSKLLEIKGILKSPKISSWSETSQVTRYINFENLNFPSALSFKETFFGNPIIRVNGSASMIEGQFNGSPLLVSGVELLPFDGKKNPSASILLLNILKKLDFSKQVDLIEPLTLTGEETAIDVETKALYKNFSVLPTGLYQVTKAGVNKIEISNAYSANESDTRAQNEEIVAVKKGISKPKILESDLLFTLALISLGLLLIDLILISILGREV